MNPVRITVALAVSLLALTCLGLGVFGMLASFEPPGSWVALWIYALLELGILIAATLWSMNGSESPQTPPGTKPAETAPTVVQAVAHVVGSFGSVESAQWVAADTVVHEGDPLR